MLVLIEFSPKIQENNKYDYLLSFRLIPIHSNALSMSITLPYSPTRTHSASVSYTILIVSSCDGNGMRYFSSRIEYRLYRENRYDEI